MTSKKPEARSFIMQPEAKTFMAYWHSLRKPGEGLIPKRADFNPAGIKSLLKDLTICDIEPNDIRYRLVGTALVERSHMEITGRYLSEFIPRTQVAGAMQRVRTCLSHPCGLYRQYEETYQTDITCTLEVYSFPLLTGPGEFDQTISLCLPLGFRKPDDDDYAGYHFELQREDIFIDIGAGIPENAQLLSID